MNKYLLEILVCPKSGDKLDYLRETNELICKTSKLAYSIKDGIPIMLVQEARVLSDDELKKMWCYENRYWEKNKRYCGNYYW